ncbi:hypothetical protein [Fibrobacter sp. UWB13]|uniref:hypothetical protein n=1 Tax=Fibrobacter sp. UWB13 TaxID=1896204 RepID=UPI000A0AA0C5|nr:hypothetical protein [Fibrobacter sp. UWB13]SMG32371.1 hypothetical protein SAMN05720489_2213 [Fibrobacter sp. UWB13]
MTLRKDMLAIVDMTEAAAFNSGHWVDSNNLAPDVRGDLSKVDMLSLNDVKDLIFLDSYGEQIDPVIGNTYLRAKYFGKPNVYYESSFDSINRINNERLNAYTHLAQLLGVTMIANIEMSTQQTSSGLAARLGLGDGRKIGGGLAVQGQSLEGSYADERKIDARIQQTIEKRLDRKFIHFEYYDPIEMTQERWNEAENYLKENGLLYIEDFRNLLVSRNPKYGLKKFDFKQYQYSSDMSKYFSIGASLGIAKAGSVGAVFLKACLGFNLNINLDVKRQFQEYSRDSVLFAMGYDDYNHGISELNNIVEQYKSINNLFDDGKLDNVEIAEKLVKRGLDIKEVSDLTKMPVDDVKKIDEYVKVESKRDGESESSKKK